MVFDVSNICSLSWLVDDELVEPYFKIGSCYGTVYRHCGPETLRSADTSAPLPNCA